MGIFRQFCNMTKFIFQSLFVLCIFNAWTQTNMSLLSRVNYQQLHQANLNDVWGYVDEFGNEYAIVGTSKGTSVLDISDPTQPTEVFWLPGSTSIWRDPCVYGDVAYITTEAEDGLSIIDLSPLPSSNVLPTYTYYGNSTPQLLSAHTCYIDENGIAYIFGSNKGNGGVLMLDVQTDPFNPAEIGSFDNWYVHDGFVRNDTMFLAHIADGFVSLVDVSDKANPLLLGTQNTPNNFAHNIWPTDDGQIAYTTDEVSGAFIAAYDITDPQNIREVDRFQNSPGKGVVPHNTHVRGNYLITSYYSDGVIVNDITYPDNIIKVAEFDTYPTQTSGFDGDWGVYPFLPSGNLVVSDITEGLFILGVNYQQASYLEGTITDLNTGLPLTAVNIQIANDDHVEGSRSDGTYKTGLLGVGNHNVTYTKIGYYPQILNVSLSQGAITIQDVQLVPIPPYNLTVNVFEQGTTNPIPDAQILLKTELIEHNGLTNGLGQEVLTLYYQQNYNLTIAKWGYFPSCFDQEINDQTGVLNIYLAKGYHDEFSFDLGWLISGSATTGMWERGIPAGTSEGTAPDVDADYDCSDKAYITGNDSALNVDVDDVDNGMTVLVSPTMDLTTYSDPHINFHYWFFCFHGNPPDDTLKVYVNNGLEIVEIASLATITTSWSPMSIRISELITPTSTMTVSFRISDYSPNVNITEAGVDYFFVTNSSVLNVNELSQAVYIYPNPARDHIIIESNQDETFKLIDLNGNVLIHGVTLDKKAYVDISKLAVGTYLLHSGSTSKLVIKE
jgi:choice-of-anchor B domain-containing protein